MFAFNRARALACPAATAVLSLTFATSAHADHPGFAGAAGTAGPIITLGADTLPAGKLAGGVRVSYAKPEHLSDAELAHRAGQHIHAHTTDYLLSPSASVAYGVADNFTVSLSLPYVRRDDLREGTHQHSGGVAVNGVEELGSPSGIGDATLLGQYRLVGDEHDPWRVAVLAGVKLPTGATHERAPSGERLETEHQPGTGSWDPLIGAALSRRLGRVSVDANALYQFSTSGAQATTLGDRAQYNLAISFRVGGESPHEHHHTHGEGPDEHAHGHGPAVDLVLELNGEWEGRQKIGGVTKQESGGRVLYLSPGVRLSAPEGWSASLSLGVPVAQRIRLSHPENDYRLIAGVARTF
jgi:hypothetical protein